MLNLQAVNHFYGNQHSLWNVDLVLRPGECIGVLGREGMGKTTLVNCIAGHLPVASGRMTWHWRPAAGSHPPVRSIAQRHWYRLRATR